MLTADSKTYIKFVKLIGKSFLAGGVAFGMANSYGPALFPAPFLGFISGVFEAAALIIIDLKPFSEKMRFQTQKWFLFVVVAIVIYVILRHHFVLNIPGFKEPILLGYALLPTAHADFIARGSEITTVMADFGYDANIVFTRFSLDVVATLLALAWGLLFFTLTGFIGSFAKKADHDARATDTGTKTQ